MEIRRAILLGSELTKEVYEAGSVVEVEKALHNLYTSGNKIQDIQVWSNGDTFSDEKTFYVHVIDQLRGLTSKGEKKNLIPKAKKFKMIF
jgi:hypothetical protein